MDIIYKVDIHQQKTENKTNKKTSTSHFIQKLSQNGSYIGL